MLRLIRRIRRFWNADVLAELSAIRQQLAQRDELSRQMEAALLTIALNSGLHPETHQGAPPLETPPGPEAPNPD